ncbi:transaldolase family protein [Proteiniclasticum sp. C24MP]|uniref:transaldolase family protein n=1 Tax=Proteiniclasticum sp. C24MP TaxID=3374101 RepID=UPI0037547754
MYLDTANLAEISEAFKTGVFQGVTTNPTILLKEKTDRMKQIRDILALGISRLYVQVLGDSAEALIEDYRRVRSLNEEGRIAYKVSMDVHGLEAVKRIKEEDPDAEILGTAIYSADQAILGALAGCDSVAPYVNRMENNGVNPFEAIQKMRMFFDDRGLACTIVAASFKNTNQIVGALTAGAHTATIPYDLFLQMINKDVAVNAIKVFNQHGEELERQTR